MAAHQRTVAQLQPLVKDLPEFLQIAAGGKRHINQIDGHNALIEASVILRLSVFIYIGGQKAAAAHAGIAVTLAVFIHLQLQHLLFTDVVRHHALGGALGGKAGQVVVLAVFVNVVLLQHINELGECRRDPNAAFVLYTLIALHQHFLDNQRQIVLFLLALGFIQVHKYRNKGRLTIGGQQRHHLILNGLHTAADLVTQAFFHHFTQLFLGNGSVHLLHFLL